MKDFTRYLSIPYRDGGRDFKGVDCWGLVYLFLKNEFGVDIESHDDIRCGELLKIREMMEKERAKWIQVSGPGQAGDVVNIPMTRNDWHCGVIPVDGWILHISQGTFSGLIREDDIRMKHRIKGYYRYYLMPRNNV